MKWKPSPIIKLYEALGTLGDGRIAIDGNSARVRSSAGTKTYDVQYDPDQNAITANDNGSYWQGYLGYPSITFLLAKGMIAFDPQFTEYLKGFAWKEINQQFKNDFAKTQTFVDEEIQRRFGLDLELFHQKLEQMLAEINTLGLNRLASKQKPPQ